MYRSNGKTEKNNGACKNWYGRARPGERKLTAKEILLIFIAKFTEAKVDSPKQTLIAKMQR